MSSRALRKLQRQMDLGAIPRSDDVEAKEEEEEEEDANNFVKPASSFFGLLNKSEEDVPEFQEEEEEKIEDEGEKQNVSIPTSTKSGKKNKKKKNKKNKESMTTMLDSSSSQRPKNKHLDLSAMTLEELDKAIREINEKLGPHVSAPATHATSPVSISENLSVHCRNLLSVDTRFLNAEAEMKRMFGARVVGNEGRTPAVGGRSQGRTFKKSNLAVPKVEWPRIEKFGLEMSVVKQENGISEFIFTHSLSYQHVQKQFWGCVGTHDPNTLTALLQIHPYHVDCLLQLSEVAKQSGDWQNAGDFVERALYSFERAFHPMFNISSGSGRLSYQRLENRPFFLALHRQIQFLTRRGCWRTAFEFDKLLLGMDPKYDPLCVLLSIDFHALKSHQYSYFLSLQAEWLSAAYFPNFVFSVAYAKFKVEEQSKDTVHEQSGLLLQRAICWFPSIVPALLDKCSEKDIIVGQSSVLLGNSVNSTPYLALLSDLFVEQNHSLWKEPEVMDWLKTNAKVVINRLQSSSDPDTIEGRRIYSEEYSRPVPLNVSRYILLSEHSSLLHHLPTDVRSASYMLYDPLPPVDSISSYDDYEPDSATTNGLLASLQRRFAPFWREDRGDGVVRGDLDVFMRELETVDVTHDGDNEEGNIASDFLRRLRDTIASLMQLEETGQAEDAETSENELVNEDT